MDHFQHYFRRTNINFDDMPTQPRAGDFAATTLEHTRPAVARHYLRHWEASKPPGAETAQTPDATVRPHHSGAVGKAPGRLPVDPAAAKKLEAGYAVTLRASQLSVLRIAHGRVWVTLTDIGPWSRVPAGDHFLSRGDSLTLLPGQALVMESFSADPAASARFTWQAVGARVSAVQPAPAVSLGDGIRQPWLDLRHAMGLALGAASRLVHGLGRVGAAAVALALTPTGLFFVAGSARKKGAGGTFDAVKGDCGAPCRL